MRLLALLGALLLSLASAQAATTTTPVTLSNTAYTDLGVGPMYVGAAGGPVVYAIADTQPADTAQGLGAVYPSAPASLLSTTSHIWAKAAIAGASAIVSAGTGVASTPLPSGAATATNQTNPQGPVAPGTAAANSLLDGCVYNTSAPSLTNGQQVAAQCDTNGRRTVVVAPYAYTPLTPGQHNLAIVASTGLTVPAGATYAIVCAATAAAKYTTDGTTTPTSSVGMTLATGSCVSLSGATVLANFRAISATGTLDDEFFK